MGRSSDNSGGVPSGGRSGLTLVELLVVIAIIGVLIALLIPAVQAAREAARRAKCANNLRQLGLAIHSYHDEHGALPPCDYACLAVPPYPHVNRGSALVQLLPYIEQQNVYEMFDFDEPFILDQVQPGTDKEIRSIVIPTFLCPSDDCGHLCA